MGRSIILLIVGAALTACASIEQRGLAAFDPPRSEPWTVYPGTLHDARTVRAAFAGDHLGGNAWLKAPVALLDLPLSITADTICLPYDAAVVANTPSPTAH
ncbi:YceK/YidQ family lipoprotein [Methylolobus aquaticus]